MQKINLGVLKAILSISELKNVLGGCGSGSGGGSGAGGCVICKCDGEDFGAKASVEDCEACCESFGATAETSPC